MYPNDTNSEHSNIICNIRIMLKQRLQDEQKQALKEGNGSKRTLIGMVLSAVKNKEIDKHGELTDGEVIAVIASEVKKRKDSAAQFEGGGRPELAEGERKEIEMLMPYMPAQLSDDAVREEVKKAIAEIGAAGPKDMGKVIAAVMAKVKGQAEGGKVSQMVKKELSK